MKAFVIACAVGLGLATGIAGAGELTGFVYNSKTDLFGYYIPDPGRAITIGGRFQFRDLAIGAQEDFAKFKPGDPKATYAPVMLEFDDTKSPKKVNEMGNTYYENSPRVLPAAFRISGSDVAFSGNDRQLGRVTFAGKLDLAALKAAHDEQPNGVVLRGDLSVGGRTFTNVAFTWFGGD